MIKKSKINFAISLAILGSAFFTSCQEDEVFQEVETKAETKEMSYTVLGKKLENPYSVENMKKAMENLKSKSSVRNSQMETEISTTHYYVRFSPKSAEEVERLEADSLILWNVPLDYEIKEYGDSTPNPSGEVSKPWLYTSTEADYDFPEGIEYEILEDLFLPEEYEENTPNARLSSSFLNELEDEALRLTGNMEKEPAKENSGINQRGLEYPQGFVKVWDSERGQLQPVEGVRVRTRRWFTYGEGYTNGGGFYRVNEDYRYDVNYTVFFENQSGFKIWSTMIDVSPASHSVGDHSNKGYNIDIYQNSRAWRFATVNNGVVKYRNYCSRFGIGLPPSDLRIAATDNSGGGAAPMLRRTWGYYGFNSNSQLYSFLLNQTGIAVAANLLGSITKYVQPDIIVKAASSQGTAAVLETTFHEIGHASHYSKVGRRFWVDYINYIITYGSYGDGSGNNAGLCAVGEGWGYHIGYSLIREEYGVNNSVITLNRHEDFIPWQTGRGDGTGLDGGNLAGWIPRGLFHDLIDLNADVVRNGFLDNASGYTNQHLFNALDSDVTTPQRFRDRLLLENSNRDQADVRNLFEGYFWN